VVGRATASRGSHPPGDRKWKAGEMTSGAKVNTVAITEYEGVSKNRFDGS